MDLQRKMRQHVLRIAKENRVTVHWTTEHWGKAMAYFDIDEPFFEEAGSAGMIVVPRIETAQDYLIALHELGHILDKNARAAYGTSPGPYETVMCEAAAWAWAAENVHTDVRPHLTSRDWDRAGRGWKSYLHRWER